jgi:hypothetical protein
MDDYNYEECIKDDVLRFIKENKIELTDEEDVLDAVYNGDVLGARSGSYFCDAYKAKCAVFSNTDLLETALEEFCYADTPEVVYRHLVNGDYEWFDIIIRQYLCPGIVREIVEEHNGVDE